MAIGVAVTTKKRIIVEAKTGIINHPYIQVLDVWELGKTAGAKKKRRTGIINVYDNHLHANQVSD